MKIFAKYLPGQVHFLDHGEGIQKLIVPVVKNHGEAMLNSVHRDKKHQTQIFKVFYGQPDVFLFLKLVKQAHDVLTGEGIAGAVPEKLPEFFIVQGIFDPIELMDQVIESIPSPVFSAA